MEKAPTVPRASALVNATTTTPIQRTFGSTWRERVGIVRGFCIKTRIAGDCSKAIIADVANLGSVAVENTHRLKAGGHTHYFLLLPNEHVMHVDVYATAEKQRTTSVKTVTKTPCRINALRFRTSERVSEWFGSCKGTATQLTPPEGHCIQALYGSVNIERYCGQVGVCYAPVSDSSSSRCAGEADDYKLTEIVRGRMTFQLSFRVHCEQPRAFVVTGESFIKDVAVVDEDQYQAFNELDPSHEYVADHWFILAKDEHVVAVCVVVEDERLVALRFRTNYRTSVWFGSPASENVAWLDCASSPGAFICGFFIEGMGTTACTGVTGIAAIYKSQGADEKGEKASKAA